MWLTRILGLGLVALATLAATPARPDDKKPAPVPVPMPQRLPTEAEVMAAKVKHAQVLLDALAREDYKRIQAEATALVRISDGAEFLNAYKTDEYAYQARTFRRAAAMMAGSAEDKNMDGVLLAYHEMTSTCVRCHQHTRNRKRD